MFVSGAYGGFSSSGASELVSDVEPVSEVATESEVITEVELPVEAASEVVRFPPNLPLATARTAAYCFLSLPF